MTQQPDQVVDREVTPPEPAPMQEPIGAVEADAADVAEQRTGVRETGEDTGSDWEAPDADVAEQRVVVDLDEDEYRT